jgi:hypothetical protein
MKRIAATVLLSALCLFCMPSFAQMPTPAPELKKLDYSSGPGPTMPT